MLLVGLPAGAVVVFGLMFRTWSLLPVYPDEIAHRIAVGRLFFDHFTRVNSIPGCVVSGTIDIPYLLYPGALIFSLYSFVQDMADNRVIAALALVGSLALLYRAGRYLADRSSVILGMSVVVMAISIGTLPAGVMVLRAEYVIVLFVCFALFGICRPKNAKADMAIAIFGILLFSMAVLTHPKAIYFLPLGAALLAKTLWDRSPYWCALGMALLGAITISAIGFASRSYNCPELPAFNADLASYNIHPFLLVQNPKEFFTALWSVNFESLEKLSRLMSQATFQKASEVALLPSVPAAKLVWITNFIISALVIETLTAAIIMAALHTRALLAGPRRQGSRGSLPNAGLLFGYLGTMVSLLLNRTQHWYDVSFWISLYQFLIFLSFMQFVGTENAASTARAAIGAAWRPLRVGLPLVLAIALVPAGAALSAVISNRYLLPGFQAGYAGPGISIAKRDLPVEQKQTAEVLQKCNFTLRSPRLVIDDLTYPGAQASYGVLPVTYGMYMGAAPFIAKARELGSAGLLLRCDRIPSGFPALPWQQSGAICCASLK